MGRGRCRLGGALKGRSRVGVPRPQGSPTRGTESGPTQVPCWFCVFSSLLESLCGFSGSLLSPLLSVCLPSIPLSLGLCLSLTVSLSLCLPVSLCSLFCLPVSFGHVSPSEPLSVQCLCVSATPCLGLLLSMFQLLSHSACGSLHTLRLDPVLHSLV